MDQPAWYSRDVRRPGQVTTSRGREGCIGLAGLVGVLALGGCASVSLDVVRADVAAGQGRLLEVPFIRQEAYQCGPAALAMVLRYHGAAVTAEEIAEALYLPSVRGTLTLELEFFARRRGFVTRGGAGTLAAVQAEVDHGRPVIVFQELGTPGYPLPHYAVVVGYDTRAGVLVLHSGPRASLVVPYAEFLRSWRARGAWTLRLAPPVGADRTRPTAPSPVP